MIKLLRETPAWRRLQLAEQMSRTARELAWAGLQKRYPNASEAELKRRFADIHLGPELARKVYGEVPPQGDER